MSKYLLIWFYLLSIKIHYFLIKEKNKRELKTEFVVLYHEIPLSYLCLGYQAQVFIVWQKFPVSSLSSKHRFSLNL